jgi:hypothetical protein
VYKVLHKGEYKNSVNHFPYESSGNPLLVRVFPSFLMTKYSKCGVVENDISFSSSCAQIQKTVAYMSVVVAVGPIT